MADDDSNPYHYIPNFPGNLVATIMYGLVLLWGLGSSVYYKQWWFGTAFFIGSALETLGYIGRTLAADEDTVDNSGYYIWQIICLTMAPSFYMAGIYYLLAKFTVIYGKGISRLMPMWYSYIFISCDLFSIIIQGAGGAIAGSDTTNPDNADIGINVLIAGLVIQLCAILVFGGFCLDYYFLVQKRKKQALEQNPELNLLTKEELDEEVFESKFAFIRNKRPLFKLFIFAIIACTTLIFIRSVFRTIEFGVSEESVLRTREAYMFGFDTIPVYIGICLMLLMHPGRVFGRDTQIIVKTKAYKQAKNIGDVSDSNENGDFELQEAR